MTDLRVAPDAAGGSVAARRVAARPVLRRGSNEPGAGESGGGDRVTAEVSAPGTGAPVPPAASTALFRIPTSDRGASVGALHPPHGVWTAGREHTATLARVGAWLLVLTGPVALIWLATSRPGVAPAPPAALVIDPGPESAVAAAGEAAALNWLAGGVSGTAGPAVTVDVTPPGDPAATGPQVWSVLVAVAGGTADSIPTYLQVPLVVEAAGDALPAIAVLGQPAIVPGPGPAVADAPSDYSTVLALTDARAATAAAFVTALLTGGDVTPLTSPGSSIRAVSPPPATRVEVRSVNTTDGADAAAVELAVTAELTSSAEAGAATSETTRTATYYLALASRDGRWEISALRPGPVFTVAPAQRTPADPAPAANPAPAPAD